MVASTESPESPQIWRDLITGQRRRNHVLTGVIASVVMAHVVLVAVIVAASTHDGSAGLAVAGVLIVVMAGSYAIYMPLTLNRLGEVHDPQRQAALEQMVQGLAERLGINAPQVRIIDDVPQALAFRWGRTSVVVFTTGLLRLFDDDQEALQSVAAHELAHIANHDSWLGVVVHAAMQWTTLVSLLVKAYARALRALCAAFLNATNQSSGPIVSGLRGGFRVSYHLAPLIYRLGSAAMIISRLISMGLCRQREFAADAVAAHLTGKPQALGRALACLEQQETTLRRGRNFVQELSVAGPDLTEGLDELFATHPSTERRIAMLQAYAEGAGTFRTGIGPFIASLAAVVLVFGGISAAMLNSTTPPSSTPAAYTGLPAPDPNSVSEPTTVEDSPASSAASGTQEVQQPPDTGAPSTGETDWAATAQQYRGQIGKQVTFSCPPEGSPSHVWGTDLYTDDSSVCTAAVHAGLISLRRGGVVTITMRGGTASYAGSTRRGITTDAYGSWDSSFTFGASASPPTRQVTVTPPRPTVSPAPSPAPQSPPRITDVETYQEGVLVYLRILFTDPDGDAQGFGFRGVDGSGWAPESHPFSSPSYGRVGPGRVDYPFNHGCGTDQEIQSDVEVWIYDATGMRSEPRAVHLRCAT